VSLKRGGECAPLFLIQAYDAPSTWAIKPLIPRPINTPNAAQWCRHADHAASEIGTLTIRQLSVWPRPRCPCPCPSRPPPMYTCTHGATCCMCVCDLGVSVRIRDAQAAVTVVLRVLPVVGGNRDALMLFRGLSIVGLPWHLGVRWIQRTVLCLGPGRSRQGPDVLAGPRMAIWMNEAGIDGRISTEAHERFVLHIRGIDAPTLSPKCSQPSHQSLKNPPIPIAEGVSGLLHHELAALGFSGDERRVGRFLRLW